MSLFSRRYHRVIAPSSNPRGSATVVAIKLLEQLHGSPIENHAASSGWPGTGGYVAHGGTTGRSNAAGADPGELVPHLRKVVVETP